MRSPGYWIKEGIFSHTECESILVFLSKNNVGRNRAGIRNLMRVDEVSSLARDERLLSTCREISGKPLIPYKATLFEKTGGGELARGDSSGHSSADRIASYCQRLGAGQSKIWCHFFTCSFISSQKNSCDPNSSRSVGTFERSASRGPRFACPKAQ